MSAATCSRRCRRTFANWSTLAQDQYLEVRTLLSGYLLSSQGDRMLMANSVEGRFPFLDRRVAALAESLPASYKLRVLDEKHVLKRAARGLVPEAVLERKKQPYRAPDALSFAERPASSGSTRWPARRRSREAGVFAPRRRASCSPSAAHRRRQGQFSNADNMAVVGILSTQLVYDQFIRQRPTPDADVPLRTLVDRVADARLTSR